MGNNIMFEREIKFIIDFNLNKVKRLGAFFTLPDLARSGVHPAITQYISAELDYLIYIDRQNLLRNSVFDYSGPEINNLFGDIAAEIKKKKLLPFDECRRLLQMAVVFNVNYLLRPRWTLQRFVFENDTPRSSEEVKLFLNYAYFYDYFKNIVRSFIEKRNLASVTASELSMLLEKIQKELIAQHKDTVLENGLASIAEFLNTGDVNKSRVSVAAAEYFLREKDCRQEIYKIRALLSQDGRSRYDIEDFKKAFAASLPYPADTDLFGAASAGDDEPETGGLFETVNLDPKKKKPASDAERFLEEELDSFSKQQEQLAEEREAALSPEPEPDVELPPAETVWHPVVEVSKEENLRQLVRELEALSGDESDNPPAEPGGQSGVKEVILADPDEIQPEGETEAGEEDILAPLSEDAETPPVQLALAREIPATPSMRQQDTVFHLILPGDDDSQAHRAVPDDTAGSFTLNLDALHGDKLLPEQDTAVEAEALPELLQEQVDEPGAQSSVEGADELAPGFIPDESTQDSESSLPEPEVASVNPDEVIQVSESSLPEPAPEPVEQLIEEESELFGRFSTKETMKIVASVFNGDSVDFVNTIEQVDACTNLADAEILLNSVFLSYQVNPLTNNEAVTLKSRIAAFFREREDGN